MIPLRSAMTDETASQEILTRSFTPGRAYWNQRARLAADRDRLMLLSRAVSWPSGMTLYQYSQLIASCLEFSPDLILELGRGYGNSTCAFTEAANLLGGASHTRVLSLCNTGEWVTRTVPALRSVVDNDWF